MVNEDKVNTIWGRGEIGRVWLLFFSIILGHLLGLSLLRTKENSRWGSTDCTSLLCFSFWAVQMETQNQPHNVFRWISKMEACWAAQRTLAQRSEMFYFYVAREETKATGYFQIALRSHTPVRLHLHSTPRSHPTSVVPLLT